MRKIFNDVQVQFIRNNYKTVTYADMSRSDLFKGLTSKQIRNKARGMGIKKTRTFNDDYFDVIDTARKAYFIGFIYADGYITDYNEMGISIHYDDREILEELNNDLGGKHMIKERKRTTTFNGYTYDTHTADFRVYSKPICDGLKHNGISTRKTKSDVFPKIDANYLADFIRGYFDGDGCVYKHTTQGYNMIHFTCGSEIFLKYLMNTIDNQVGVLGKIYKEKKYKYRLMYYRRDDATKLLDYMYHDKANIKLTRKYEKHLYNGSPKKEMIG